MSSCAKRNVIGSKPFQLGLTLALATLFAGALAKGDPQVFAAALGLVVLGCGILWYESLSLPVVIACFFWTGMNLPFRQLAETARWGVLGLAAVVGLLIWMQKRGRFRLDAFHFLALCTIVILLLSYEISANPAMTLLKSASVGLLFLYAAAGAGLYIEGNVLFFRGAVLACEGIVYASAISYVVLGYPVYGNPNSLGAVMGVVAWPILLWDLLARRCAPPGGANCSP